MTGKKESLDQPYGATPSQQQELLFNSSVDITFLIAVEAGQRFRFITVNQAFLNASQLTLDQVQYKYAEEVIPTGLYPAMFAKFLQAIAERQTIQWEDNSDYPDGRKTGIMNLTPIFNEQGLCTMLAGTLHDITERKKAEELLKARETQLKLIYNTVNDAIFLIAVEPGPRYRFSSVNHAFLLATGLQKEQVEEKYADEIIPEPSRSLVLSKYAQAISEHRMIEWEETTDYPAGKKTGIVNITPVFTGQDECSMLVGTVHDITERKKTLEEKERISYLLNERVKELTTLSRTDHALQSDNRPLNRILEELLSIFPSGWQYPNITEVSITLDDTHYSSPGFNNIMSRQSAAFTTPVGRWGKIEIGYTQETPAEDEGPFLSEERDLINMLAEKLRNYLARKEATQQLISEKELSDKIIETLPGLFYMIDEEGRYIRWNKLKETISGISHEEMSAMHSLDFFDDEEKPVMQKAITEGFEKGYVEVEAHVTTKEKKKLLFYFTGVVIDYKGQPCLMGMGIDITERKKAAELLQKEKDLSESVINSMPGIFYLFDETGKYIRWNKNHELVSGYTATDMESMHPLKFFDEEEGKRVTQAITRVFTEGAATIEAAFRIKNGTTIPYYFNGVCILYEGRRCIMGVGIDITERKQAEALLQKSEANLHSIFDHTDTIYVLLDPDFKVISFNHRAADFIKEEFGATLQLHTVLWQYFPKERQQLAFERMTDAFTGKQVNFESSYLQPGGLYNWYHVRMYPITNPEQKNFGLMVAVSDITEKKFMEQEIVKRNVQEQKKITRAVLRAQEKERNKIGQELHDNINQILAGAKMYLGLTRNRRERAMELVEQSSILIDDAINEIRSLTQEQVTPRLQIDLRRLIQSLVDNFNMQKSFTTTFRYNFDKADINNDLKLNIYRIIQEGTNNIVKHAGASNVNILLEKVDPDIHIVLSDDGKGFNMHDQQPGIGIANIRNRIESFNGRVSFTSKPGGGFTLDAYIPFSSS